MGHEVLVVGAYARYANVVKENYHLGFNIKSGPLSFLVPTECRLPSWTIALIAVALVIAILSMIVAIIYWLHLAYKIGESVAPI